MIKTELARQIVSYIPPADVLEEKLEQIQARGYKVLNIIETKQPNGMGCSDQAFIIVYDKESEVK